MINHRFRIFKYFAFQDLVRLLVGKLIPGFRSAGFQKLQDKENKLSIILAHDRFSAISSHEAKLTSKVADVTVTFLLRLAGSDVWVFNQVIICKEYEFVLSVFKAKFGRAPQTMIDAGANIGLVTIFFKAANAEASILAIEPDHDNFEIIQQNILLNKFSGIELMECALWPEKKNLSLVNDFRDKLDWSLRVKEDMDGKITSIAPSDAVTYIGDNLDLFKIDIEGGESELFKIGNNMNWLSRVRAIAIEIHEEQANRGLIISILESNGFTISTHGELTLGINKAFVLNN
jgi:FkbM family methyltransferase